MCICNKHVGQFSTWHFSPCHWTLTSHWQYKIKHKIKLNISKVQGNKWEWANLYKKLNFTYLCPHITLCFNIFETFLTKLSIKSESKVLMFLVAHMEPNCGCKAGSWTRCNADQVSRFDLMIDFVYPYLGLKGHMPGTCDLVALHYESF